MFKYDETGAVVPLSKTPPKEIKRDFCGNPIEDVPEVTTTPMKRNNHETSVI